jgi:molecular chaperone DnaK (HSP70)
VEVTFSLDTNGILTVTAMDKVTGSQAKADIKADRGRLTDTDIERMIADAERYREEVHNASVLYRPSVPPYQYHYTTIPLYHFTL